MSTPSMNEDSLLHSRLKNCLQTILELEDNLAGTHLGPVGEEQQQKTIAALQAWQPDFVAANHCTGFNMMAVLREKFGAKFIPASIGTVIEW